MKRKKFALLLVVLAIPITIAVFVFGSIVTQLFQHNFVREQVRFVVPGTPFEIIHSRIGIHPMLAEYDRDITFVVKGQKGVTSPLMIDTCGGYPINCYLIKTPNSIMLRLDDAVSEHLIDLTKQSVNVITHAMGEAYYGEINPDDDSSGWSMTSNYPSTLEVLVGGHPAHRLTQLLKVSQEKYIGRIDGSAGNLRFITESESPEIKINHLIEKST